MRKKQRKSLNDSLAWIRAHPYASNLDVPEELIEQWIFEDNEDDPKPSGFYLSIFSFGFLQGEALRSPLPRGHSHSMPVSRLLECFELWQLKLGLVEIHRKTELQFDPLPLFAFPEREEIKYWPLVAPNQPET